MRLSDLKKLKPYKKENVGDKFWCVAVKVSRAMQFKRPNAIQHYDSLSFCFWANKFCARLSLDMRTTLFCKTDLSAIV